MDDQIRISDADRDRVAARLRDHFAEGRLTGDELDERIAAALSARTFGDLRRVLADLPGPAPAPPQPERPRARPAPVLRRGPRLLPLALLAVLGVALLAGGGWPLLVLAKVFLLFWLVTLAAGLLAAGRFRRRLRRGWPGFHRQPERRGAGWRHSGPWRPGPWGEG